MPRFKPLEKNQQPAPTTYNAEDAINSTQWRKTTYTVGKDKTPRSYFHNNAVRHKSPGPGVYLAVESAYTKIGRSHIAPKRH